MEIYRIYFIGSFLTAIIAGIAIGLLMQCFGLI